MEIFSFNFCIFGRKFSDKKTFFRQFFDSPKFGTDGHNATSPQNRLGVAAMHWLTCYSNL